MTDQINNYFNQGIVQQAFNTQRNILIWEYIADETAFLKKQENSVKLLYSFVQQSAQTNFILSLGKMFDTPSSKYPTQCILSFLNLVKNTSTSIEIVETTNTIRILKEFNCSQELIDSVTCPDKNLFPKIFSGYYLDQYRLPSLQDDIITMKLMRDKAVAHNETIATLFFELSVAERLLKFATELISVFGMAYHSTIWKTEDYSFLKANAERNAFFIKANIKSLKKAS